jgi:hypothetical protein
MKFNWGRLSAFYSLRLYRLGEKWKLSRILGPRERDENLRSFAGVSQGGIAAVIVG